MPNGFGRGFGRGFGGGGWGFGFRGSSPPWPFVGIGRGGLPRCGYFVSGPAGMPMPTGYPPYGPGAMPYYEGYAPPSGTIPGEPELDFLRSQAEMIRGQLEQIDARMKELETGE
jgi:hypothetical protein